MGNPALELVCSQVVHPISHLSFSVSSQRREKQVKKKKKNKNKRYRPYSGLISGRARSRPLEGEEEEEDLAPARLHNMNQGQIMCQIMYTRLL